MKMTKHRLWLAALAILTGYIACKKMDQPVNHPRGQPTGQRFFTDHLSKNPVIQAATMFVQRQNEQYHFAGKLAEQLGYPIWDKAAVISGTNNNKVTADSTHLVYIPFVRDTEQSVNAILAISLNATDTNYKILCDWQYKDTATTGMSPASLAMTFVMLNDAVFGSRVFAITDNSLFSDSTKYVKISGVSAPSFLSTGSQQVTMYTYSYTICWTEYLDQYEGQLHGCQPGDPNCNEYIEIHPCYTISWDLGGDPPGGGGNGNPPPGGNGGTGAGGGGGWNPPPPPCGTEPVPLNSLTSCGPGWVPVDPGGGTSNIPVDTLLSIYSKAMNVTADSVYNNLSKPVNREYFFLGVQNLNNMIVIRNIKSNIPARLSDSTNVIPDLALDAGQTILFIWHSHVSASIDLRDRGSFSPDDINYLRKSICLHTNFVSFADCGNKRYALVITDPVKAAAFFSNTSLYKIYENYYTNVGTDYQTQQELSIKNVIGNNSINGIALYVSNNPAKTNYTLLNP